LRVWALLDEKPTPHLSGEKPDDWDYTFTTTYAGSMKRGRVTDSSIQPNGMSLYQSPADNLADGRVQLRQPLCKCVGGRTPCAGIARSIENEKKILNNNRSVQSMPKTNDSRDHLVFPLPIGSWVPTDETFDMEELLKTETVPLHYTQPVLFWVQNLDPQSYSSLTGHVLVAKRFVVASIRCFVRVNGVSVRILDSKFIIHKDRCNEILRERSWKEGTWAEYAGTEAMNWMDFGTDKEQSSRAAKRLKHKIPPVVEKLSLENRNLQIHHSVVRTPTKVYTKAIDGCCGGSLKYNGILAVGLQLDKIISIDWQTGNTLWERNVIGVLSLDISFGNKVLVGDDRGGVHVFHLPCATNDSQETDTYFSFSKKDRFSVQVQSSSMWVERVSWSENGMHFVAAAGKQVMIDGIVMNHEATVYSVEFLRNEQVAVALYGGLLLVSFGDGVLKLDKKLDIGSAAVLACAVSSDADSIAIGCLDKRVRVFQRSKGSDDWSARDWVGFNGAVTSLSYDGEDEYLAALGGSTLLVTRRDIKAGEIPVLCCATMEESGKNSEVKYESFLWSNTGQFNFLMVAAVHGGDSRYLHLFDINATNDTVLRKSYPVKSIPIEKGDHFAFTNGGKCILLWGREGVSLTKIVKLEWLH